MRIHSPTSETVSRHVSLAGIGRLDPAARARGRRGLQKSVSGLILIAALGAAGCGGSAADDASTSQTTAHHTGAARPAAARTAVAVRLTYHRLFSLAAPVRDPASVALSGERFALLGGLTSADVSTANITVADGHRVLETTALPIAQHDAQAAQLDGIVYVFGGGSFSELAHIVSFDPQRRVVSAAGMLPRAASDVAVAASTTTAFIVGGYDGERWLNTVLAWRPGSPPRVVALLPVGLRYAAAAVADGALIVIGGSTPAAASTTIYRVEPNTGHVAVIGHLPHPVTHAAAATLDGEVFLVGGRGDSLTSQSSDIWRVDPRTGRVTRAGRLPQPLSDSAVVPLAGGLVIAGGLSPTGTQADVGRLTPSG